MALPKMPAFTFNHVDQLDKLTDAPATTKAKFDSRGNEIKDYLDNTLTPAIEAELDAKIPLTQKGTANGVATLDANGQVPSDQLGNVPAGITDHGQLSGLGDDDHPQYAKASDLAAHLAENATETQKGHVQLATSAEVTAGANTTKAVTPAGLKIELDKKVNITTLQDNGFLERAKNISGSDLNALVANGFYSGSNMGNAPDSGFYYIEVIRHGTGESYILQRLTGVTGTNIGKVFQRVKNNTVWTSWELMNPPVVSQQKKVQVYNTLNQSIPNVGFTPITFNATLFDNGSQHSDSVQNTRLTCKESGLYLVSADVIFVSNATGYRQLLIRVDGAASYGNITVPAITQSDIDTAIATSALINLSVNQYVEALVTQTSSGALDIRSLARFGMVKVG